MITIDQAVKRYRGVPVVDSVSLELGRVGVTSIIGANGAGKSTLLSMIGRLVPLDGGRIHVDGLDVTTTRGDVLARRLAVLRQENHLGVRLSVRDLVGLGRFPHSRGRPGPADRAAIDRAIGYLDLDALADRFIDELSGGQRQRAYVAMVLAQDTDYVLLDEPLNNLDLRHAVDIMRLLRGAADEFGKRIMLVVHDINFASAYSDEIVAMRAGRVVARGAPDAVMRPDVLHAVFGVDVDVRDVNGHLVGFYYR